MPIKTIFHDRNTGRGSAVKDGLKASEGTLAGFIDIDLEVDESNILPCVISILENGYDIVTGYRIYKIEFNPYCIFRHLISFGYRKLLRLLMNTSLLDTETGYKFFRLDKILSLLELSSNDHWFWDTEIMLTAEMCGLKIKEIPCLYLRSTAKPSTVKHVRDSLNQLVELIRFKAKKKNRRN